METEKTDEAKGGNRTSTKATKPIVDQMTDVAVSDNADVGMGNTSSLKSTNGGLSICVIVIETRNRNGHFKNPSVTSRC